MWLGLALTSAGERGLYFPEGMSTYRNHMCRPRNSTTLALLCQRPDWVRGYKTPRSGRIVSHTTVFSDHVSADPNSTTITLLIFIDYADGECARKSSLRTTVAIQTRPRPQLLGVGRTNIDSLAKLLSNMNQ